ncbi:MAG: IclR family transcriptional regulator [Proteobacteria bacterium]|nr:IclR family transcriptional regulator [Pseudomonadota bacterium]
MALSRKLAAADDAPAPYFTATLAKGLDVLEALAEVEDVNLTDLSRRLGVSGPTLFRILATLGQCGYVQKAAKTSRYRLTLKAWEVGARAVRRLTMRDVARPWVEALAKESREAVHLGVLQGSGVVIIDKVDTPHPVKVDTYVGQRAPAHCAAIGKAILAYESAATLDAFFDHALPRFTPTTISGRRQLERELALTRDRGYALNHEEWRQGVCAVAVPIRCHSGEVAASLSLTMPTERFAKEAIAQFVAALLRAAQAISRDLGGERRESGASRP